MIPEIVWPVMKQMGDSGLLIFKQKCLLPLRPLKDLGLSMIYTHVEPLNQYILSEQPTNFIRFLLGLSVSPVRLEKLPILLGVVKSSFFKSVF